MVKIEKARDADIPALLSLLQALFAIEKDFEADADRQRRGLQALINASGEQAVLLVARVEDSVVGMASVQLAISTAQGAPSAWIEDVIVSERHRGKGIGRALLHAVVGWASDQGATRAQLLADRDNAAALSFYARCGLQPTNLIALRIPDLTRFE
ncbi:MAG: GNAT family N-acetyltransferase [Burkholderiales bacterium]|jgi:GNAT superfamily N-acetyltransferase